jgi:hypothetical protein
LFLMTKTTKNKISRFYLEIRSVGVWISWCVAVSK